MLCLFLNQKNQVLVFGDKCVKDECKGTVVMEMVHYSKEKKLYCTVIKERGNTSNIIPSIGVHDYFTAIRDMGNWDITISASREIIEALGLSLGDRNIKLVEIKSNLNFKEDFIKEISSIKHPRNWKRAYMYLIYTFNKRRKAQIL